MHARAPQVQSGKLDEEDGAGADEFSLEDIFADIRSRRFLHFYAVPKVPLSLSSGPG